MTTRKSQPDTKKPAAASAKTAKAGTRKPANQAKPKRPMGRPTKYTDEIASRICSQIAEGMSLRSVCKAEDMPSCATVFSWMRSHPDFLKQYEISTAERANAHAEEVLDIADDGSNDWMEIHDKDGECIGYKVNGEAVQRSRLRIDTRKWLMSKMQPKKFGDKVDVNHGVQPENPLAILMQQLAGKTLKPVVDEGDAE